MADPDSTPPPAPTPPETPAAKATPKGDVSAPEVNPPAPWVAPFPVKGDVLVRFSADVSLNGQRFDRGVNYVVDASVAQAFAHVALPPSKE